MLPVKPDYLVLLIRQHLTITLVSVTLALVIAVPLGIIAVRLRRATGPLLWVLGVFYTVPSLALFAMLIPVLGLGFRPATLALVLYSLLTLVRNTVVGIRSVPPATVETARAAGMNSLQILWRVELPLSLPVILAGVRQVTVMVIGVAAVAAYVGAGGLGVLIFRGLATLNPAVTLTGAIPLILMALGADALLERLQRGFSSHAH